ncbi:MAG: response regulator [FCB group bacterium]|nr:response regulator [FCB group bacterium]
MEIHSSDKTKVLVVDDDRMITELLLTYLPQFNFEVTAYTNSQKALDAIKENQYDIVLTDLVMPIVSGMEIVKAVSETGFDTQIIIATGFATAESAIKAVRYGVYDYIRKPFTPSEIRVVLSRAVEKLRIMRDNIRLQARIEKMLSNVTMLHNISTILYQVTDFDLIVEMVLDTMTEGFAIEKVGLFLYNPSTSRYEIFRSKGISEELIRTLTFDSGDLVLGKRISAETPTFLDTGHLNRNGDQNRQSGQSSSNIGLYPLLYQEKLYGFIGILQEKSDEKNKEKDQLLKILSTQIAPVFGLRSAKENSAETDQFNELPFLDRIDARLREATANHRSEFYALLKLAPLNAEADSQDYGEICKRFRDLAGVEFSMANSFYWLGPDSFMVSSNPGAVVSLELACVNLRRNIEDYTSGDGGKPAATVRYNIVSYPDDADTASELILKLNESIFYESNQIIKRESGEKIY